MRDITKRLIMAMGMDMIPDNTVCCDFGIDPNNPNPQFGALQWGWKNEVFTNTELDEALGDGKKLTGLACRRSWQGRLNPYCCVFHTAYDDLPPEED